MDNSILFWDKPEKIMSIEEWKNISADGAPPCVYVPNMSDDDMLKWKAKLVGAKKGTHPRVEIRKTFHKTHKERNSSVYCQCLIIVSFEDIDEYKDCKAMISMNGKAGLDFTELEELKIAINEATEVLTKLNKK